MTISKTSMMNDGLAKEMSLMSSGMTPGFAHAPRRFTHGKGVFLYDEDGKEYIDFCAGTITNSIGHAHPKAVEFMQKRVAEVWNVHDYSTPFRLRLLEKLDAMTPEGIDSFQFYTGGSETIEAGLRALNSFFSGCRNEIAAFSNGYHGKTLGSRQLFHWRFPFEEGSQTHQLPFPDFFGLKQRDRYAFESSCLDQIEKIFREKNIGAVVGESILGAGGTLQGSKEFWEKFERLRNGFGILLFADEISMGFGRTGENFGFQNAGITPDLIAFAKGIGGGFPAMVLAGRSEIMNVLPFGASGGSLTTFSGNPLSIGAMYITVNIYEEEKLALNAKNLGASMFTMLKKLAGEFSEIHDFRCAGLMGSLYLKRETLQESCEIAFDLHKACLDCGLFVMTFSNHFRITPPLTITEKELNKGFDRLQKAMKTVFQS